LENLTDTLMGRVDKLMEGSGLSPVWGSALVSTTPKSIAVQELAVQVEALKAAVREIALEVQRLADQR
jgi:hypothetical protein